MAEAWQVTLSSGPPDPSVHGGFPRRLERVRARFGRLAGSGSVAGLVALPGCHFGSRVPIHSQDFVSHDRSSSVSLRRSSGTAT